MSEKCGRCGNPIGYLKYYCRDCKKFLAGGKPRKHRKICGGCVNDYYNQKYEGKNPFGGKGCMSYSGNQVKIKDVYYSSTQITPNIHWKLECFNYNRSGG